MRLLRGVVPLGVVVVLVVVLVLTGVVGLAVQQRIIAIGRPEAPTVEVHFEEVPKALQTPGGLLEVSRIDAPAEVLERTESGNVGFFDFGANVSRIRVAAVYRYHVPLAGKWTIIRRRDKVFVIAPRVVPSLPVAIDTGTMRQSTEAGWLRFDKAATAAAAQRQLTQALGQRAASPSYVAQQREVARTTVSEFVARWGVAPANSVAAKNVRVVFDDEPVRDLVGAAFGGEGAP